MGDPDRFDSWKAIADYLGRDVRTVRRWEADGLPVHRIAGARGKSVFAYRREIDEWLARVRPTAGPAPAMPVVPGEPAIPAVAPLVRPWSARVSPRFAIALVVVTAMAALWRVMAPGAAESQQNIGVSAERVVSRGLDGVERWRYDFPDRTRVILPDSTSPVQSASPGSDGALVVTAYELASPDGTPVGGAIRRFSDQGRLERQFTLDDRWTFTGERVFEAPWAITDVEPLAAYGRQRLAVSAHHLTWWPSVVTLLDERWQREATFVHSGWVESLQWLSLHRLAIGGFSQQRDGAMAALLDADNLDGASPDSAEFQCTSCRTGSPIAYVVIPRSELNRITASEFNRASLERVPNGLLVHTSEVERPGRVGSLIGAILEFDENLQLKSAKYNNRYWDKHRALELEGKLGHDREHCPDRDGPNHLMAWDRLAGWHPIAVPPLRPSA